MKAKILLILLGSTLFLQSCAPSLKMASVVSQDQKMGYDGTITSQKKHFVSLSPYTALKKLDLAKEKTLFLLSIENDGKDSIDISNKNISVIFDCVGKDRTTNIINIQQCDDFLSDLAKEYNINERKFIYKTLYDIKLDSESSSADSESTEDKIKDLNDDIEIMRASNEQVQESMKEIVIKSEPQTISPGDTLSGIVVCDTGYLNDKMEGNFQVIVSVDAEKHKFTFNRSLTD